MDRETTIWLMFSALALACTAGGLAGGGAVLVPLLVTATTLLCTAHKPIRAMVTDKLSALYGAGWLRATVVTLLGVAMIQYLPVEMALFAAGDIVAYIELMAGIAFIATRMRLATATKVATHWVRTTPARIIRRATRAIRTRALRRPGLRRLDDPDGWAFA